MPIIDAAIRTITCDAKDCPKSITFDRKEEKVVFENPNNVWLRSTRVVQSADGRNHVYCSDECEVKGAATGQHNIPEVKKVVEGNAAAVALAAKAAAAQRQAEEALRSGQPAQIQVTD